MMTRMKFALMILFLMMIPSITSATVTVSTTQSGADSGSVIAERTFTVSGRGWSGDCNSASIDLSECGVCSISENTTKTIIGGSVSWTTLTASQANSQKITVSVSGTCTPDSGYTTFDVKTAPSLSATVSPTSTSVTQGSTFSISLSIQNNGDTTARFGSITVSPSDFSVSSGCSPSDISGGQSSGVSCTIAASGSATTGTRTLSVIISPTNADSETETVYVTVNAAPGEPEEPGGGGGAGGVAGPSKDKVSETWTKITPGKVEIMKITDPEFGIKQIYITVKNTANNVRISITKLDDKPATVVHEITGKVYKYMEIETRNIDEDNLERVNIQFQVNKTWIDENNIDPDTIILNRYHNNTWEKLPTDKTGEDSGFFYYESLTPGLSTFAITGEEIAEEVEEEAVPVCGDGKCEGDEATTCPQDCESPTEEVTGEVIGVEGAAGGISRYIILVLLGAGIVILGYFGWQYMQRTEMKERVKWDQGDI